MPAPLKHMYTINIPLCLNLSPTPPPPKGHTIITPAQISLNIITPMPRKDTNPFYTLYPSENHYTLYHTRRKQCVHTYPQNYNIPVFFLFQNKWEQSFKTLDYVRTIQSVSHKYNF